ncbi:MAG: DUF1819 family protein [Prevotellaceae bacterium]|nr:DUF1819 family protein [Prevotellaceae bacterium]
MLYELNRILPLLLGLNADELLAKEVEENNLLMVNNRKSRKNYLAELKRRFTVAPRSFWLSFQSMDEKAQRLALFYVLLKCYRLVLDFHVNVTMKKWYSIDRKVGIDDIKMELAQIAAGDAFVDSWTETTKNRTASAYLTFLNQAGLCEKKTGELHQAPVTDEDYLYYLKAGEVWFLEACFLQPYEIERIKQLNR